MRQSEVEGVGEDGDAGGDRAKVDGRQHALSVYDVSDRISEQSVDECYQLVEYDVEERLQRGYEIVTMMQCLLASAFAFDLPTAARWGWDRPDTANESQGIRGDSGRTTDGAGSL